MIAYLMALEVTDSTLIAPGGMLLTAAGLFALGMKTYKEARGIDLETAKRNEAAAKERVKETEGDLQAKLRPLTERIKALEDEIRMMREENAEEIRKMREESTADREAHDADMEKLRDQLLTERGKNFKLRQILNDNGLSTPEGLGPS